MDRPNHRRTAARFFLVLFLVLLAKWCGSWIVGFPVFSLLAHTSLIYVTASILFGWVGLAATLLAHVVFLGLRGDGGVSMGELLAYVVSGGLSWVVFRHVPRLSRALGDPRSLAWFVAIAAVGGVLTPAVITIGYAHADQPLSMVQARVSLGPQVK